MHIATGSLKHRLWYNCAHMQFYNAIDDYKGTFRGCVHSYFQFKINGSNNWVKELICLKLILLSDCSCCLCGFCYKAQRKENRILKK